MNNLKEIRKEKKLTIKELSKLSGVSCITITNIEKGYHEPYAKTLYKLAKALNCDYDGIITKKGN